MYVVLAVLSIASCTQPKPEHQIESVSELLDSLMERGGSVNHNIYYSHSSSFNSSDKVFGDQYAFFYSFDKSEKKDQDISHFLSEKTPELLDRLCKTAVNNYRYSSNDSVDYSITLNDEPKELVNFKRYRYDNRHDVISFAHTTMRPATHCSKIYDPAPIRALLQKFISEQKNVEKHDVCYEWDEGVPFSDDIVGNRAVCPNSPDSLAATRTTGTLYKIHVGDEKRTESVIADLTKRVVKLITERPILGTHYRSHLHKMGSKKQERMYSLSVSNRGPGMFYVLVQPWGEDFYVLEVESEGAQSWAIASFWCDVKCIHNNNVTKISQPDDTPSKAADTSRPDDTPSGYTKMDSLFLGL